jgi:hypothetical protein
MHRVELRTDLEDDKRSGGRQQEKCGHRGLGWVDFGLYADNLSPTDAVPGLRSDAMGGILTESLLL